MSDKKFVRYHGCFLTKNGKRVKLDLEAVEHLAGIIATQTIPPGYWDTEITTGKDHYTIILKKAVFDFGA